MRLPVVPQISTKDGVSAKNARLTNCLKESKKGGDKAVVRPGLVLDAQASGVGHGLVVFNNELVSVYGATLYSGVPAGVQYPDAVFYMPLSADIGDELGNATSMTSGSPTFSTAQVACNAASYVGSSAYMIQPDIASNTATAFGYGDFTIEAWVYPTVLGSGSTIYNRTINSVNNKIWVYFNSATTVGFYVRDNATIATTTGTFSSVLNTWAHVALVRSSGDIKVYVNGIEEASVLGTSINIVDSIGNVDTLCCAITGYWSDFMISDVAKYSGSFSPACLVGIDPTIITTVTGTHFDFAQSPI